MDVLLTKLFDLLSLEYMFSVIIATYFAIKIVDVLNGNRIVPAWAKCLISCVTGAILFAVFYLFTDETFERLITSFFGAVFIYDKAIKFLLEQLNVGYRKE